MLGGINTGLTGGVFVNRGNLTVTNVAAVNSANEILFNDTRVGSALQTFTVDLGNNVNGRSHPRSTFPRSARPTTDNLFHRRKHRLARDDQRHPHLRVQQFGGQLTTPIQFTGDLSNTSGFNFGSSGTNLLNGPITLVHGVLGITSDGQLGGAGNALFLAVGDLTNGGLDLLQPSTTIAHPIVLTATTRIFNLSGQTNTISMPSPGPAAWSRTGPGR